MRVLFLHQNFPGQFVHVTRALDRSGQHELLALVPTSNRIAPMIPTRTYRFDPPGADRTVPLASHFTHRVARATAAAAAMRELASKGFAPDLVVGHCGWGETLFVKDIWPDARLIVHAEFYYAVEGADIGFDPEFPVLDPVATRMRVRTRNTATLQAVMEADQAISPTRWQAGSFPPALQPKIAIAHEGVDTDRVRPDANAQITLQRSHLTLRPGDEVVTFVARNLEPYRGYHIFMRALPRILAARPNAHVVIVGDDGVSYGAAPQGGGTWKAHFLREVAAGLDLSRVHFVGRVPYSILLNVMQVSAVHVYLTYPFVLSWSLLEAMSAGALVVGSRTAPVEEVITQDHNGLLCDFFDVDGLAEIIITALARPDRFLPMREAARRTAVERFDLARVCLPAWLDLLGS